MADPKKAPLGDGLAAKARRLLIGRKKKLDDAIDPPATKRKIKK